MVYVCHVKVLMEIFSFDSFFCYHNSKTFFFIFLQIEVCQFILRNPSKILQNAVSEFIWLHRLKKLLMICIEQLTVPNAAQAIPMRMLETFTSEPVVERYIEDNTRVQSYLDHVFRYLVERRYFERIRGILEQKCPPLDGETLHAPNQVSEALFQMILRPLILSNRGFSYGSVICQAFTKHILSVKFTDPIRNYLIPCLAEHTEFPFEYLMRSLQHLSSEAKSDEKMQVDNVLTDKPQKQEATIFSSYLLNAILILDRRQLGNCSMPC